jgi:eukaryotic-like serine/threonine-protein kinase
MLGPFGETLVVDWGLAKVIGRVAESKELPEGTLQISGGDGSATRAGSLLGTPQCMSPEQARGEVARLGPATDIYSLGATLYCVLTGLPPVQGADAVETLEKVWKGDWLPARQVQPSVPGGLDAICGRAMALRAEDRYSSVVELAADVERWLADEPVSAWREPWPTRARRWTRRHRQLVTGATALLIAAVPLSLLLAVNREEARRQADRDTVLISRSYTAERKARQQAEANFQRTRAAIDEFFTTVSQSKLFDVPGLQPLRKELLESAVRYYRNLAAEAGEDLTVQAGLAAAHFRLAEAYFEVDQSNDSITEVNAGLGPRGAAPAGTPC